MTEKILKKIKVLAGIVLFTMLVLGIPEGFGIIYDVDADDREVTWAGNGGYLYYTVNDGKATIVGYRNTTNEATEVNIPSEIVSGNGENRYPVTSIGSDAFEDWGILKKITIPESVTSIGSGAFWGCKSLEDITIPEGVTSIGGYAFYFCESLKSIEIPSGVTSIEEYTFGSCTSLKNITIPTSVTSIGYRTFYECKSLESITIPTSVTSIGGSAFSKCESLKSIEIPSGVTIIDQYTFSECSNLKSIEIPTSVTSIGQYAFFECSSLENITIPTNVTNIGESAFNTCTHLTSIGIPSSVTSIGTSAFSSCSNLNSILFRGTISTNNFGEYAFQNCAQNATVYYRGDNWDEILSHGRFQNNVTRVSTFGIDDIEGHEYDGTAYSPNLTVQYGEPLTEDTDYTRSYKVKNGEDWVDAADVINVGDYRVVISGKAGTDYEGMEGAKEFSVTRKAVTVKAQDMEFAYDGKAHTWPQYDVTGLVGTDSIEAVVKGSISSVNESPVENVVSSIEFRSGEANNYEVTTQNGILTMVYVPVTVTFDANNGSGKTATQDSVRGKTVNLKKNAFAYEGHTFDEWNTKPDGKGRSYADGASVKLEEDMTLYAQWNKNEQKKPVKPEPVSIKDAKVVLKSAKVVYNKKDQTPVVKTIRKLNLKEGKDYTVSVQSSKGKTVKSYKSPGKYTLVIKGKGNYTGSTKVAYEIVKAANPLNVIRKKSTFNVPLSKIKKKDQTIKNDKIFSFKKKGAGTVTYSISSVKSGKKSYKKYFSISSKGNLIVKKDLKKASYTVKVKVSAKGDKNYKSATKTVEFTVKVK